MIQREEDRSSVFQDLASTLSEQRGGFPGELEALQGGWSPGRTRTPGDRRG